MMSESDNDVTFVELMASYHRAGLPLSVCCDVGTKPSEGGWSARSTLLSTWKGKRARTVEKFSNEGKRGNKSNRRDIRPAAISGVTPWLCNLDVLQLIILSDASAGGNTIRSFQLLGKVKATRRK